MDGVTIARRVTAREETASLEAMDTPNPTLRLARGAAIGAVALFALYAVGVGLVAPPIARKVAAEKIGEALGRPAAIDRVRVNPFTLEASVEGLRIYEPDGKTVFASFDALDLDAAARSITHLAPIIESATLRGLRVSLVRDGDTHYNVTDIVQRLGTPPAKAHEERRAAFSVSNIRLTGARIDFDDRPMKRRHEVTDLEVALPFVSSLPVHAKDLVKPAISARVNGSPFHVEGDTLPFEPTLATNLSIDVKEIDLARYASYSPVPLPVTIDSGRLAGRVTVRFEEEAKAKEPSVRIAATALLTDFACSTPEAKPWVNTRRIDVEVAELRPLARIVRLEHVRIDGGEARLERSRDGSLQLVSLPASDTASTPSRPWTVALKRFEVSDFSVALADHSVRPELRERVRIASLEGTDLTPEHGGNVAAKLVFERGGEVTIDGTIAPEPFAVEARVDARSIDLAPLRPYVSQFPTVAIRKALASAKGTVHVRGTGNAMRVSYAGAAAIANLATFETATKEDLLNWKAAVARDIRFDWTPNAPLSLAVRDLVVDSAYSRVIVHPDGKLNVQQLRFAADDDAARAHAQTVESQPKNVRIDRIAFVNSRLNFTDLYVKPNYTADVGELEGVVTGLSSDPDSRGNVELRGRYDRTSPVTIEGQVNPFAPELFLDIAAKGSDIELPKLTAYSQRYAGYGIREGRLNLDVHYHLEGGKLEGRNKIVLEQLTFGDKVESPDAIKLPILFAVNLLKDANGRIDLELPVSGSLDDPQFEMSGLIAQVVTSLLKKAVTSPFEFLSAVFGGAPAEGAPASGKDLAFVDFDPGLDDIGPKARGKLERLAEVLRERPGLKLEVASRLDEGRELRALEFAALQRAVAEAKRRAVGGDGAVKVDDPEYAKYVRAAYANAGLPAGDWSVATMETRLIERAPIDPETLRSLAAKRADGVMKYLTAEGHLPAERVVLASADAAQAGDAASRVVFALR